ncbi:class B secretin-like G-protein coupled receptor GPRcal2, putative [Pediculus humanus corporis]|uniref:Class B secretin-like G-protein coupled receptor GPRcal2, putative n=1 Tax=Pediculus humanus subsp. corporis TaxID=121224 RepID=E0VE04_PEDHC|nr:class B secretin-like G-protein coupled receptor GPRcal2, putative [Pediculus humanus corporis]EEB11610.1 class B secretin-like G-protein coupled receptor GPRcal2, putative [Pediculus humanus corporis]
MSSGEYLNKTVEICVEKFKNFLPPNGEIYCNWTWDSVLCWPPTKEDTVAVQNCPKDRGIDPSKLVYKKCLPGGRWEGRIKGHDDSPQGWTNYTTCFTPETWQLFKMLYADSEDTAKIKLDIAEKTRTLEIVGFSVSLIALLFSLAIFFRFRGLRNSRTRIHKNLFIAMEIQVVVRLSLYIDQVIVKEKINFWQGIHDTPFLCEISYILLEYARTAMFMWMFVEGLYLHNMITVTVFHKEQSYYTMYSIIGWGSPIIITSAWILVMITYYKTSKCWWGYNLTIYFWILEGPRLTVVVLNFLFLLNIIRVLVVKLRQSRKSEIEQVRKAVRATAVLLPLLGITNIISMSKSPLEKSVWEFALWSYGTHFLTSFQGFFIAFLYCFLNGEVRAVVMKSVSTYFSLRNNQQHKQFQHHKQSTSKTTTNDKTNGKQIENQNDDVNDAQWKRTRV